MHENDKEYPQSVLATYDVVNQVIGVGGFGQVSLVVDKKSKEKLALKTIQFPRTMTVEDVCKEVSILQQLDHPCVIHLKDCKVSDSHLYILLEYMAGGDLATRLRTKHVLGERQAKVIMYQLCLALQYLHDRTIIHCDIKPANILLADSSDECLVKLTDFGMSHVKEFDQTKNVLKGTRHYMAPEVYSEMKYTNKVDIWSAGIILYECLIGCRPPMEPEWKRVPAFTRNMLKKNPEHRPDIEVVLQQKWFEDEVKQLVERLMNNGKTKSTLDIPREPRDFGNQGFYYVCPQGSSFIELEKDKCSSSTSTSDSSTGTESSTSTDSSSDNTSSGSISSVDSHITTDSDSSTNSDSDSSDSYYLQEEVYSFKHDEIIIKTNVSE